METILQNGIEKFKQQSEKQAVFLKVTEKLRHALSSARLTRRFPAGLATAGERFLLVISPLIETAWADGRVTRREADAIIAAARIYGIPATDSEYRKLIHDLITKPVPSAIDRSWQQIRNLYRMLPRRSREVFGSALVIQTEYVAAQDTDSLICFLNGTSEQTRREILEKVRAELEAVKSDKRFAGRLMPFNRKRPLTAPRLRPMGI